MTTPKIKLTVQTACNETLLPEQKSIKRYLQAAIPYRAVITVRFVTPEESAGLNQEFRQKANSTNVLTFPYTEKPVCEADLVLCPAVIEKEALEQGKPLEAHYAHMIVHGALHAQGYDHIIEEDAKKMEGLERKILETLGISNPYCDG